MTHNNEGNKIHDLILKIKEASCFDVMSIWAKSNIQKYHALTINFDTKISHKEEKHDLILKNEEYFI